MRSKHTLRGTCRSRPLVNIQVHKLPQHSRLQPARTKPEAGSLPWQAPYHVLHAYADLAITVEGPVEAHDVRRVALVQDLQLPYDLVADGRLDLQVNELGKR